MELIPDDRVRLMPLQPDAFLWLLLLLLLLHRLVLLLMLLRLLLLTPVHCLLFRCP